MRLVHLKVFDPFGTFALASIIHDHFILRLQVKGQGIYAFVTLVDGVSYSEELRKSLILTVRKQVRLLFRTLVFMIMTYSKIFHSMVPSLPLLCHGPLEIPKYSSF